MPEIKVVDVSTLPVEGKDFKGISLPFYKGKKYGVMSLDNYQAHIVSIVGDKTRQDAGLALKFVGFTDEVNINTSVVNTNPNAEVYFSNAKKMFVFKDGNTFYLQHETLSATYNEGSTVRQDKIFLNDVVLYSYDKAQGGIMRISDVEIVQDFGDSTSALMSQDAVTRKFAEAKTEETQDINAVNGRIDTLSSKVDTNKADTTSKLATKVDKTTYQSDKELANTEIAGIKSSKVDKTTKVNGHALSTDVTITKGDIQLGNVDNTSDAAKPISTATQTALDTKVDKTTKVNGKPLSADITLNKADVGLDKVDNTADLDKPISTSQKVVNDDFDTRLRWAALNNPPSWFKDSLVCMYDVKRQGATNENLKANPVLKDFSPNHLDMQLKNFAFEGMSGMDGYGTNFSKWGELSNNRQEYTLSNGILTITAQKELGPKFALLFTQGVRQLFKVRIKGVPFGNAINLYQGDSNKLSLGGDGDYVVDYTNQEATGYFGFALKSIQSNVNVTIEQLPLYEDALVFDGEDDYGISENQPILTDYTVIAKRKILLFSTVYGSVAVKTNKNPSDGAFAFERQTGVYSFGSQTSLIPASRTISYQTATSYNGKQIKRGSIIDTSNKILFGGYSSAAPSNDNVSMALYQFLLFDRTLTQEEIEWVKKNVMQPEGDSYDRSPLSPLYESSGAKMIGDEEYNFNGAEYNEKEMTDLFVSGGMAAEANKYGIHIDYAHEGKVTRTGNMALHRVFGGLPIQNGIVACYLTDDGKETLIDWSKPEEIIKDGSKGQMMARIPTHYYTFTEDENGLQIDLNQYPSKGAIEIPLHYVSMYEASIARDTNTLASVVNLTANYRGGGNQADRDGQDNTLLGRPVTAKSLTSFREAAKKRGQGWIDYDEFVHADLAMLFYIEYGTLNVQLPVNAELTPEGFRQGGLGSGVTNLSYNAWNAFSGTYPFIPCGHSDVLGNNSGEVEYKMPKAYNDAVGDGKEHSTFVPRFHCIENLIGHIYKWVDGVLIDIQADNAGGKSKLYVCRDIDKMGSTITEDYEYIGDIARVNGYAKIIMGGKYGLLIPREVGGSSVNYFCDYTYTSIPKEGNSLRALYVGGNALLGSYAGFACAYSSYSPSSPDANIGSRSCFFPRNYDNNIIV